ncbi:MAG: 2-C-methyl-D-erythritol 4-phosphate cytidylyltransferase [Paracoccaceae bacterium]|jgi:2-C-methyl-D-erythritol 4-phosphate cytidylyltransferase/2-C-methyl-D-erythritol 2,4-cyclodiphosphate synthase
MRLWLRHKASAPNRVPVDLKRYMILRNAAVIVAAGQGIRAGGDVPKQWRNIAGRTSVQWSVSTFQDHPEIDEIILVLHPDDMKRADEFEADDKISVVVGGAERAASVLAGLRKLTKTSPHRVLIHDVARPCVSARIITDVIAALAQNPGAAPAVAVSDALWVGQDNQVTGTKDRAGLFRAQTPQGFHFQQILDAHSTFQGQAADDVAVARTAGIKIAIVRGEEDNLKITLPEDFDRAARILRGNMDIRTGNGYDVHAFEPGDHVVLCGHKIPHDMALNGHSDADVAMHAITDALYGALAKGDIGQWFPPSDDKWRGAASDIFLRHAVDLARQDGFAISHADCTIICEMPKIGPHSLPMRNNLAEILEIDLERISVKATTSEQLGFAGRKEGIAASATVTLVKS